MSFLFGSDKTKKRTHEEYVNELLIRNPNVKVIEKYIDANTKILHKCLIHNINWKTTPSRALQGVGCEMCKKERFFNSRCKSNEEYLNEIHNIAPHIIPLEPYIKMKEPIFHYCKIHKVTWKTSPDNILHGYSCPKCKREKIGKKNTKTYDEYINKLKELNNNIICIGDYKNSTTPTLHKCLLDGYEWYVKPSNIIFGGGCPKCVGKLLKSHKEYVNELSLLNPDIEVLDTYINAKTPIFHKCKKDGNIWKAAPYSILNGTGCPQCNESHGEKQIRKWLQNHNISYETQKIFKDCKDKRGLPFDFYLSDYNLVIEYDGKQHYEPNKYFGGEKEFYKRVKHDKMKDDYCKNNNIKILRIPYFENVKDKLDNYYLFA